MANNDLETQLVKYLSDAHAMEQQVDKMLDGMISTTKDPEMRRHLEHHKEETQRHKQLIDERLEAHGESPSKLKGVGASMAAMGKGLMDMGRSDNAGKNARDGFATEHFEIAAYELLERVARLAGDEATADVARRNRADEEAMAQKIAGAWDKTTRLSLEEEGVT